MLSANPSSIAWAGPKPKPAPAPGVGQGAPGGLPSFPGFGGGGSGIPSTPFGGNLPTGGGTVAGNGQPTGLPQMPGTGGGFGAAPPPMNNNVTPSSDITFLQSEYKKRLSADPTKRATDRMTSAVRDATTGLNKELGGNMARRGILQSGIRTSGEQALAGQAQRQIASGAADIAMGRERDLDNLTMGGLPIMTAQDQLGLSKQRLGLDQWSAQNQAEVHRQQLQLQAQGQAQQWQAQLMNLWSTYMNTFR